jgi:hypothetical protein
MNELAQRVATFLNFLVAYQVARMLEMPPWNPGDESEAARLQSLLELE